MNGVAFFWIVVAVILGIIECATPQLVSIWFCGGAIVSALIAYFVTDMLWVSIVVFIIVSTLLLIFTRPLVKKKMLVKAEPTNADRILGKEAIVIEDINPIENVGQIKVDGQIWSAKSQQPILKGEKVTVSSIEGVKAVVTK